MTKQSLLIVSFLLVLTILLGYNYFAQPFAYLGFEQAVENTVPEEPQTELLTPAQELLKQLTTQQKIAQLLAVPITVTPDFENQAVASTSSRIQWVQQYNPGTVTLFGSAVSTQSAGTTISLITTSTENADAGLVPLIAVDHEGGSVQRLSGKGFSRLDSWRQLCQKNQVDAQIALEQSVEELQQVGIDVVFAPVLDVAANNPALGSRTCSADFNLVGSRAKLAANIFYEHDILPVFKHFPGIGAINTDLHHSFATVTVGQEEASLYRDLLAFYAQRTIGIMISHAGVINQDPDIPCSLSPACVGQLADNFSNALIFSDDVLMDSAKFVSAADQQNGLSEPTLEEIVLKAIVAGNDQVVMGPGVSDEELTQLVEKLSTAYANNNFLQQAVDDQVEKVLQYKLE